MKPLRLIYLTCWLLIALLTTCASPSTDPASQRLPTRAPLTLTPAPTPTLLSISAQAYYEEGLARRRANDVEGAVQSFTWAIQNMPDFALAHVARSSAYLAQGKLRLALADVERALELAPDNASAHALRGEILRLLGRPRRALEAFEHALELDPGLKTETFRSRWLAARAARNEELLLDLSREYARAHPRDPLRHYYRGWGYVESGETRVAISLLIEGIEESDDPPALLWFALGEAYASDRSWQQAVISLENTRMLVQAGDQTLAIHSDRPVADLFGALGRAYLGAGRCVDAETMLKYAIDIGAPASQYATWLEEARFCQTPTPTATPYPTITPG